MYNLDIPFLIFDDGTPEGIHFTYADLLRVYYNLKYFVPRLAVTCATLIGGVGVASVVERYIWLFIAGGFHGLLAYSMKDGSFISHVFECYVSDFQWVFERAAEIVRFIRRDDPVAISSNWILAYENLLAWGTVFVGYFAFSYTISFCAYALSCVNKAQEALENPVASTILGWAAFIAFILLLEFCYRRRIVALKLAVGVLKTFAYLNGLYSKIRNTVSQRYGSSFRAWREAYSMPNIRYRYCKLGPRDIRLLRIKRKALFRVLECEIIVHNLDEPEHTISYQAISYTWAKEKRTHAISVDGHHFKVTPTVYDILNDRRSWTNSPVIWIDSICIDQSDNAEKSIQVPLMREIYESAVDVLICLGKAPDAGRAVYLISNINMALISSSYDPGCEDEVIARLWNDQRSKLFGDPFLLALARMVSRSYWERIWTVQEIAAGARLSISYGGYLMDWYMFQTTAKFFSNPQRSELFILLNAGLISTATTPLCLINRERMAKTRETYREDNPSWLWQLVYRHINYKAGNLRDKIYALQGISKDPKAIEINYSRDIGAVYLEAASYFLKQGTLVNLLGYAGIGWNKPQLEPEAEPITIPSWVPDFSYSTAIATLTSPGCIYLTAMWLPTSMNLCSEEKDSTAKTISTKAFFVDEIEELTVPFSPENTQLGSLEQEHDF
jgi:hypothetical protein